MINYIETHIVEHCNLKCRGCSHFSGLSQPQFKNLDVYKTEFTQLAKITNNYIHTIRIMGGEPLLHPQVVEFCTFTRNLFPKSEIVLVSNGILLPNLKDEDIEILNNNNIALCISNYGLKLDYEKMNKFKRHYFHSKNDMYNISLDLTGNQNITTSFFNCDIVQGHWYFFKNGRIYQCCVMANIDYFCNYFNKEIKYNLDDISIDIYNNSLPEIEKFLATPHEACKYCDTIARHKSYQKFGISKGEIQEWTVT